MSIVNCINWPPMRIRNKIIAFCNLEVIAKFIIADLVNYTTRLSNIFSDDSFSPRKMTNIEQHIMCGIFSQSEQQAKTINKDIHTILC